MKNKLLKEESAPYLPQLNRPFTEIVNGLEQENVEWRPVIVRVGQLKPLQKNVTVDKMNSMLDSLKNDEEFSPLFISNDDHILDGHHRAAAVIKNGGRDEKIKCIRIDLDKDNGVRMLNKVSDRMEFEEEHKKEQDQEKNKPKQVENKNVLRFNKKQLEEYAKKVIENNLEEYDLNENDLEEVSNISPELNSRIIKRTEELYKKNNGKTESDFNKYYDIAIKEFGYDTKTFKDYMEKYFIPFSDDDLNEDNDELSDDYDFWKFFDGHEITSLQFEGVVYVDGKNKVLVRAYDGKKIRPTKQQIRTLEKEAYEEEGGDELRVRDLMGENELEEGPRTHSELRRQKIKSYPEKYYSKSRMRPYERKKYTGSYDISEDNEDRKYVVSAYNRITNRREMLIKPTTKEEAENIKSSFEMVGMGKYVEFKVEPRTVYDAEMIRHRGFPEDQAHYLNEKEISEDKINKYLQLKEKYNVKNLPSEELSLEEQDKFMEELINIKENIPNNNKKIVKLNEKQFTEMITNIKNEHKFNQSYAQAGLPVAGELPALEE